LGQLRELVGSVGATPRSALIGALTVVDLVHRPGQALHQVLSELPRAVPFGTAEPVWTIDRFLPAYEQQWRKAAHATVGLERYLGAVGQLPDCHAWAALQGSGDLSAALPVLDDVLSRDGIDPHSISMMRRVFFSHPVCSVCACLDRMLSVPDDMGLAGRCDGYRGRGSLWRTREPARHGRDTDASEEEHCAVPTNAEPLAATGHHSEALTWVAPVLLCRRCKTACRNSSTHCLVSKPRCWRRCSSAVRKK